MAVHAHVLPLPAATLTSLVYTETIQIDGLLRIAGTTSIAGAAENGWVRTANVSNLS